MSTINQRVISRVLEDLLKKSSRKDFKMASDLTLLHKQASATSTVTGGSRDLYKEQVSDLVRITYASIGIPIKSSKDLLKYQEWDLTFNENQEVIFFALYKLTPYGKKLGLLGSDGSAEGKNKTKDLLKNQFKKSGYYLEASHAVEHIAVKAGTPPVPNHMVSQIIGKPITPLPDGVHYKRTISGLGELTKIMLGRPKGVRIGSEIQDWDDDFTAHQACLLDF
jgi:hypothetical protein